MANTRTQIVEAIKEAEVVVLFAPSKNKDSAIARHIKKLIKQDEDYSGDKELQNGEKLGMNGADPDKITDNINPNPEAKKEPQKTPDVLIPEDDEGPNEVVPRAKLETPVLEYETYEPVLPAGLSGEWYKWIDSLKALGSSARKGIFNKYLKLKYSFTEYSPTSGKSVIIYADDLLMNAAVYDLQSTIKNIFVEHDILKGGKIILFARDPANLEIVKELINQAGLNNDSIVSVLENENISKKGDFSETKMLLRKARQIGAIDGENELLAVIRGPLRGKWNKDKKLEALLKDNELPLIIIGPEKGVYSFAGAIHAALKVKLSEEKNRIWLIMLPPIRSLTEDIKSLYAGYKRALKALQSA